MGHYTFGVPMNMVKWDSVMVQVKFKRQSSIQNRLILRNLGIKELLTLT